MKLIDVILVAIHSMKHSMTVRADRHQVIKRRLDFAFQCSKWHNVVGFREILSKWPIFFSEMEVANLTFILVSLLAPPS